MGSDGLVTADSLEVVAHIMRPGKVKVYILPGGALPKYATPDAIGADVRIRAAVSVRVMEPNGIFRKTVYDFLGPPPSDNLALTSRIRYQRKKKRWLYVLKPGESVTFGIGFATEMPEGMFYWIAPRSGLASKYRIQVGNAPGTVDPGYRGEACVIVVNQGDKPFAIYWGMRIAQIIFQWAIFPELELVQEHSDLSTTVRGSGGLGSTGLG